LLLYVLFFLSGFSALVYQTSWQRMLGLFSGSDSISTTLVVGAFLLGLGLGSLVASTFADRLSDRKAIVAFALCELGIAGFAIASKLIFYDVIFSQMASIAVARTLVFVVAFISLLIPTLLMGMSLPLLARGTVQRIETAPERIGWLYGVNTLGAALGTFAAGCIIIGHVGYEVTVYLAAAVNLSIGVGALLLALGYTASDAVFSWKPGAAREMFFVPVRVWKWCFLLFVSGFIIISLEIVWFRVIGTMLQSTAYSFAVVLGWFLLGDALGILLGAVVVRRVDSPWHFFLWLQGVVTLYAAGALWLIAFAHHWPAFADLFIGFDQGGLGADPTVGHIVMIFATVALVVGPPAVMLGMSFPITQKAIQDDLEVVGQRVGLIQVANILGNTAGAIVTGAILLHYLGTSGTLRLLAILGLLFVIALLIDGLRAGVNPLKQLGNVALAAGLGITLIGFPNGIHFWSSLHMVRPGEQAILGEDRTGITLLKVTGPDSATLYIAGQRQGRIPFFRHHVIQTIIGTLTHPNPRSVLVIGHGGGGTLYGAGTNPATHQVRVIEIVAPVYEIMNKFGALGNSEAVNRLLSDPRYQRSVGDARHLLFTDSTRYDVITADAMLPVSSRSGLLYSVEFFEQVRARLNPGGIAVQWAPTPRTVRSFLSVFPYVTEVRLRRHQSWGWLIGSDQPLQFDPQAVARRLQEPAIREYVAAAGMNVDGITRALRNSHVKIWGPNDPRPEDVNTDLFPKDEFYLNARP